MRKLIAAFMTSLDAVVQAPGGPEEDASGDFHYGGWVWPHADPKEKPMGGALEQPFELVLGRRTYDIFAGYWPQVPSDAPHGGIANRFNGTTKHVATHHPGTLAWANSRPLGTDVIAALRALKEEDGPDLLTQGSAELVRQLLASDVVDELRLAIYPVLLGRGKRLFDDDIQASAFRLVESRASATGILFTHYLRDGAVRTGVHPALQAE